MAHESTLVHTDPGIQANLRIQYSFEGIHLFWVLFIASSVPVKERIVNHWPFFFLSKQGEGSASQMADKQRS